MNKVYSNFLRGCDIFYLVEGDFGGRVDSYVRTTSVSSMAGAGLGRHGLFGCSAAGERADALSLGEFALPPRRDRRILQVGCGGRAEQGIWQTREVLPPCTVCLFVFVFGTVGVTLDKNWSISLSGR
ncbi:hypothetical protein Zmor_027719 [Zophobas morio]|uniref:Uncharacterized protein n=1 Tax=Zophobas morio TaxID=2755281 RepID=A0AA38HTY9_9CUCU|nr:hypothetical protein Zmor_027719 [Zophobas morio]